MTPDLQYLADATRCPSCSAVLPAERNACARLRPAPDRRARRPALAGLGAGRRAARDPPPDHRAAPPRAGHDAGRRHAAARSRPPSPRRRPPAPPPPAPARPKPEWSRRRVQNLLLALGVGLLAVAAIIFLAVSWDRLGVGGRSAVMAGVTALAGFAATRTHRRGLGSTAEWLSLLTVGLAILDCAGARSADLAGLGSTSGCRLLGRRPRRAWRSSPACSPSSCRPAACASLLRCSASCRCRCCPLHVASDVDRQLALLATGLTAQTVAALALATAWPFGSRARDARVVVAVGGAVSLVVASLSPVAPRTPRTARSSSAPPCWWCSPPCSRWPAPCWPTARPTRAAVPVLDGGAAVLLVAAAWAPAYDVVPDRWLPAVLAAIGPRCSPRPCSCRAARRTVPAVVALGAALLPALAAVEPVARALEDMLGGAASGRGQVAAADVAVVADRPAVLELLVAGVALIVAAWALRVRHLAAVAVPVLTGAAVLTPPALGAGYPLTLGVAVAIAAALLVAGALLDSRGRVVLGWAALGSGAALLALATSWSFAADRRDPADAAGGGPRAARGSRGRPRGRGAARLAGGPGHQRRCCSGSPRRPRWPATRAPAGPASGRSRSACWPWSPRPSRPRSRSGPRSTTRSGRRCTRPPSRWPAPPWSPTPPPWLPGTTSRRPAADSRPPASPRPLLALTARAGRAPPAGAWRAAGRGRRCRRAGPRVRRAGRRPALGRPARGRRRRRRGRHDAGHGTAAAGSPA